MIIANPIYDSVFKYMMDDQRVAKIILSMITGFDIEDVELRPTEIRSENLASRGFTVYRMDFAARVRTSSGSRLILIEIQKAKFSTDIMRFRQYLGTQYASEKNCQEIQSEKLGRLLTVADPIFCIYLLGHRLEFSSAPIIRVARQVTDVTTGEVLTQREEFIEGLTHDCIIIQIPELKARRRTKLEKLLSIFDQEQAQADDPHAMRIDEESLPEECRDVLRTLVKAHSEADLRQKMTLEDQIISELETLERSNAASQELAAAAKVREEEAKAREQEAKAREQEAKIREQDAKIREQEARVREQDANAREAEERKLKEEALRDKDAALGDKAKMQEFFLQTLMATGLSEAEARKLLSHYPDRS